MPSLASGNSSCTACASTCAVECRRMASPSSESIATASTSASGSARATGRGLTVHPRRDHLRIVGNSSQAFVPVGNRPNRLLFGAADGDVYFGHGDSSRR